MKLKQDGDLGLIRGLYAMCPFIAGEWPLPQNPSSLENEGIFIFVHDNRSTMAYGIDAFKARNPLAWPGMAQPDDVRGLPPVVISVNECDPLRDEGIGFYRLLVHDLGVTEYLPKPLTRDAVLRLLLPHLAGGRTERGFGGGGGLGARGGHLVAVCGARGGVGTSSMALNLAYEIMDTVKGHVALVDLHVQGGEIALMLSVRPGPGLRIALEDADRVDSLFLERASIEIEPRLRLIASEEAFDVEATVTEAGLARVLDLLLQKFNFIVADVPMPLPPAMLRVLTLARQVVVVLTPDVASLRDTQNIRRLVTGVTGADRVITVLNRSDMPGGIERSLIEKAIAGKPDVIIPDLGRGMLEAINLGIPAVRRVPSLRRHLAPLVREIAGVKPGSGGRSWLRKILGR